MKKTGKKTGNESNPDLPKFITESASDNRRLPSLPEWLNRYVSQEWSSENSLAVDRWLNYLASEFEGLSHE